MRFSLDHLTVNGGIENAIAQAQEEARVEAKENDETWGRIAKAVDIAMAAEPPGRIDQDQVKHIIDAILECALPKLQRKSATKAAKDQDQRRATELTAPTDRRNKPSTWASLAAKNPT